MKAKSLIFAIILMVFYYPFNKPAQMSSDDPQQPEIAPLITATVTTTADSGDGSLRAAILAVNQAPGSSIVFNIPTGDTGFDRNSGAFIIRVRSPLPAITANSITIDGNTQPGVNPVPEIVIDGRLSPTNSNGITIKSSNNTVKGLTINNFFAGAGILIDTTAARNNSITGCFIGTDAVGKISAGNRTGIRISNGASSNKIGMAGSVVSTNVISGNTNEGVAILGAGSDGNIVANNLIGLDGTATRNQLPNLSHGIMIGTGAKANTINLNMIAGNLGNGILITDNGTSGNIIQSNSIGLTANGLARGNNMDGIAIVNGATMTDIGGINIGNTIAFNIGDGISIGSNKSDVNSVKNKISRNKIFANAGLGIDLGNDGKTANSTSDNGPNGFNDTPVITSTTATGNGTITVRGTVTSTAMNVVEIFINILPNPFNNQADFNEGQNFAIAATTTTGSFSVTIPATTQVALTATATDSNGNTSEFSEPFLLGVDQPDFVVTDLSTSPTSTVPGGKVKVRFNIKNQGMGTAPAATHNVVLSSDSTISLQDRLLVSVTTNMLSAGSSQTFMPEVSIPLDLPNGPFFVGVIVDAGGLITESQEGNNIARLAVTNLVLPDLVIRNLLINPTTINLGGSARISFNIANQGSADATNHIHEVRISSDNKIDTSDPLLTSVASAFIGVRTTDSFVIDISIANNTAPGKYFIGVITDARNALSETDETNNVSSVMINVVGQPDYDIKELSVSPAVAAPGASVSLAFKLANSGTMVVPATTLDIR
ncbi:MAG: CARDB domain-containing protein, partial [Acidobacteriota bacterium]